jgi:hypothetical protein
MLSIQKKYRSFRQSSRRRRLALSVLAVVAGAVFAQAAFASNITIASPLSGTTTTSPILVKAHNVGCNGLTPTAFGFSIDNSTTTKMGATANDLDFQNVSVSTGKHLIHFKAWIHGGICPVVDEAINVVTTTGTSGSGTGTSGSGSSGSGSSGTGSSGSGSSGSGSVSSNIPSYAVASADLDTASNWQGEHDSGTPGSSQGSTVFPATTPVYDDAREFYMTYSGRGGERWHDSFRNDSASTHFVFDTYVYVENPDQLANLELDLNQVMSNGQTVIFGTQCSTYSGTWEWTYYANGGFHWRSSNVPCKTINWTANTWHHIQFGFHRDSNGYVTHDWVEFDGVHSTFTGASALSAKSLGWAKGSQILNIQMDGYSKSSGSIKAYFHKTTFYEW